MKVIDCSLLYGHGCIGRFTGANKIYLENCIVYSSGLMTIFTLLHMSFVNGIESNDGPSMKVMWSYESNDGPMMVPWWSFDERFLTIDDAVYMCITWHYNLKQSDTITWNDLALKAGIITWNGLVIFHEYSPVGPAKINCFSSFHSLCYDKICKLA